MRDIKASDLRKMSGKEGLILQGCGGDPQEWIDGINGLLTDEGILLEDTRFQNVSRFQHDGVTNLLFPFEDVKLDVGKLAMWRLKTHEMFGGTWLSDYVDNRLGGFLQAESSENEERIKPDCPLIGADSNIFNLMSIAKRTLINNDMSTQAKEMCSRIYDCRSYNEALNVIGEYVNITDGSEDIDDSEGEGMTI